MGCLRQDRLSVLHILDGLFVCLLMAYGGRIGYFLPNSGQLGEEFRHFHCQILHRSLELVHISVELLHGCDPFLYRLCVHYQFSVTPTFVLDLGGCLLLQVSSEIVDHFS